MSLSRRKNSAYGLDNPLQGLAPAPIVAQRDPKTSDHAPLGSVWVNNSSNAYFVLTSSGNWEAQSTGSATQASLTITGAGAALTVNTGDTSLGGNLAVTGAAVVSGNLTVSGNVVANGDFDITNVQSVGITSTNNAAGAVTITANGGPLESIVVQSQQGTSLTSVDIVSSVGGITVQSGLASPSAIAINASNGGINLAAADNSTFGVTGAGKTLSLSSTGGTVAVTGTQSVAGAVNISASGAAGTLLLSGTGGATLSTTNSTLALTSGTGNINVGTDAAVKVVTVGSATGASSVAIQGGTSGVAVGANAIAQPVSIGNNTGATSVSIQAGTAAAGSILIGTTANDVPVTIGSSTGASAVLVNGGTAGVGIGTNAVAHAVVVGNSTGATSVALNAGTAGVTVGNNAIAHPIVIGNVTGATSVSIQGGTGLAGAINIGTTANAVPVVIGNATATTTVTLTTPAGIPVSALQGVNIGVNVISGAGTPNAVVTAPQGSLFLRTDGSSTSTRAYINTNGGTAWTNLVTAA